MKAGKILYLFFIIAIVELLGEAAAMSPIILVFKPLIMLSLIAYYYQSVSKPLNIHDKWILSAFSFAWLGDVFLMFIGYDELFFMLGLSSFLITHLLYSWLFWKHIKGNIWPPSLLVSLGVLIIIIIGISLSLFLYPQLADLKIPVLIYTSAIILMVIMAILRYKHVSKTSYWMILGGAILFMISDSIIAINKFYEAFPLSRVLIMTFYIAGQYYICVGALEYQRNTVNKTAL